MNAQTTDVESAAWVRAFDAAHPGLPDEELAARVTEALPGVDLEVTADVVAGWRWEATR